MINTKEIEKLNIDVRYCLQESERKTFMACLTYMGKIGYKYLKINLKRGYVIITMMPNGICNMIYRNKYSRIYIDRNINFKRLCKLVYSTL